MKHLASSVVFIFPKETGMHGNVSLAALTRNLPESNTDAELKGRSEMALSIAMINIFSLVKAFFPATSQLF